MDNNTNTLNRQVFWNEAGKAGLFVGGLSIAYAVLTVLLGKVSNGKVLIAVLVSFFNTLLWIAKFVGCIWLMRFFMKSFAEKFKSEVDNAKSRRFGAAIALFSSLLYSGYSLAYMLIVGTDTIKVQVDEALAQFAGSLDSNSLSQMESMMENLPMINFVSNFIYCLIFGVIVAAILSRNIPSRNPFDK